MNCSSCGTQLPLEATNCPMCGALTPHYYSTIAAGASPYDPTGKASSYNSQANPSPADATIAASPYSAPPGATPAPPTTYGASPYAPQAHYGGTPSSAYNSAPTSPYYNTYPPSPRPFTPPPPSVRRRNNNLVIIGVVALVLLLVGVGTFAMLGQLVKSNSQGKNGTSTTSATPTVNTTATAQVNATATAQINATTTAQASASAATATAVASENPYPPNTGTLVMNDPMHDNSRGYKWDEATLGSDGTCGYTGGTYHIHANQKGLVCVPEASNLVFKDLTFEAKLTLNQGDQEALAFRLDQNTITYYGFFVYIDGSYSIDAFQNGTLTKTLGGSSSTINKGQNQTNLLAVVVTGDSMSFYVNNQLVNKVKDSTITHSGQIGIEAYSTSGAADVSVSDVRVWSM
jgi:hypothetical protein